jgi:hypothetical protein
MRGRKSGEAQPENHVVLADALLEERHRPPLQAVHLAEIAPVCRDDRRNIRRRANDEGPQRFRTGEARCEQPVDGVDSVGSQGEQAAHNIGLDPKVGDFLLTQTAVVECRINQCQGLFALLGAIQHDIGPGQRELQPRMRLHRCCGQLADQTDQGGHLGLLEQVARSSSTISTAR